MAPSRLIGDNAGTGLAEAQTADTSGNLIGETIANGGSGIIDPLLGFLSNNGGPTETHSLLAGSLAINAESTRQNKSLVVSEQKNDSESRSALALRQSLFDAALVLALRDSAHASLFANLSGELALEQEDLLSANYAAATLAHSRATPPPVRSSIAPNTERFHRADEPEADESTIAAVDEAIAKVFG